jgi:NADH:ubiquinone oxidoreductase subunit
MANLGTTLFTLVFGKKVGVDEFGNKYYKSSKLLGKPIGRYNKERRWVVFKGKSEASKIPPYWHGWMHYTFDEVPSEKDMKKQYDWQKSYLPNLTGTGYAYLPNGHKDKLGERDMATGDYTPWRP